MILNIEIKEKELIKLVETHCREKFGIKEDMKMKERPLYISSVNLVFSGEKDDKKSEL